MKIGNLVICDIEKEYVDNLMDYMNDKQGMPFRTIAFTEKTAFLEYAGKNPIDILLIKEEMMESILIEKDIAKIILLSEGQLSLEHAEYSSIYKYQSGDNIVREILDYYVEVHGESAIISKSNETEIIGVYSPIGRTGKTTFSLIIGQQLATDASVLYINFEEFSAMDKLQHKSFSGDLSDLMYFFKQNTEMLPAKLKAIVHTIHGLEYIPPVVFSEDLRNISTKEWIDLIEKIADTAIYKKIIVDVGYMIKNVFELLQICNIIYMPIRDDAISLMKINSFEEYALQREYMDILDRIIKIKLPEFDYNGIEGDYIEQLMWGELGDYVREILRKKTV